MNSAIKTDTRVSKVSSQTHHRFMAIAIRSHAVAPASETTIPNSWSLLIVEDAIRRLTPVLRGA